jgi:hypothetical protein
VIHVVTAVINRQGENMKTITEETAATQVPAAEEQPKASKKATAGARRAPVAPKT